MNSPRCWVRFVVSGAACEIRRHVEQRHLVIVGGLKALYMLCRERLVPSAGPPCSALALAATARRLERRGSAGSRERPAVGRALSWDVSILAVPGGPLDDHAGREAHQVL